MRVPQAFQYQGSKRGLAPRILRYLPAKMNRLVEPFAGSVAVSIAVAARGRAGEFWLNDLNAPLAELLNLAINKPDYLARCYQEHWKGQEPDTLEHYYRIREDFNRTNDPTLFLYLLARCVKGSVRYNSDGLFNQSPDKRRRGTQPETMRASIKAVSRLLRGKTIVTSHDYRDVLASAKEDDVIYMDPPYQGVSGDRDARYFSGVSFDEFVSALQDLNERGIRYVVSYDGRTGERSHGRGLPASLHLVLIELEAGRSTQATLLGRKDVTVESLYLSAPLAKETGARNRKYVRDDLEQPAFLEAEAGYEKISKGIH
jgi:DNA adenine methylase